MTGDNLVTGEVRRMGVETAPLLIGSVLAMIVSDQRSNQSIDHRSFFPLWVFVLCTLIRVRKEENRFWEALVGCLVPLMAMVCNVF